MTAKGEILVRLVMDGTLSIGAVMNLMIAAIDAIMMTNVAVIVGALIMAGIPGALSIGAVMIAAAIAIMMTNVAVIVGVLTVVVMAAAGVTVTTAAAATTAKVVKGEAGATEAMSHGLSHRSRRLRRSRSRSLRRSRSLDVNPCARVVVCSRQHRSSCA